MVDGNGILHKRMCGYACHLGVLLKTPTFGCAKTFFDVDGLHKSEVLSKLDSIL
jgi:deoxyribonuclease V